MNRIAERFARLKAVGQKGCVVYIGAGDPDLESSRQLAVAFDAVGVDVLELGVPFSDPLADGLVNQLAAQRGLESGTTPAKVLELVAAIRKASELPVVLYIYYNLVHRYGPDRFIRDAAAAGVDGLLALDLPPEEADDYTERTREAGLAAIFLVAPTTPEERLEVILRRATGFVYYVSREGVTGMQAKLADSIGPMVARIRRHTELPVAVGFGISNAEQAREAARHADAIVVGSAVVDRIARLGRTAELVLEVAQYVGSLVEAVKGK